VTLALNTGQSATTASFSPPPGSVLVALVAGVSNNFSGVDTWTASDSSGLTWTARAQGTSTVQGAQGMIFTATVPAPVSLAAARPGQTWLRRFHHRQVLPLAPSVAAAVVQPPVLRGTPVRAWRLPAAGGKVTRRAGTFGQAGPPVRVLAGPVAARLRILPPRGHVTRAAGAYAGSGPPVRQLGSPVQARRLPQSGGRVLSRAGTFTSTTPQAGPPVYPLGHPVQARQFPQRGGWAAGRSGTPQPAQQVTGSAALANNSPQITISTRAGSLLVALFTRSGGLGTGALTGVTDSAGNTWRLATRGAVSGQSNTRVEAWYALNAAPVIWVQGLSGTSQTWAWNISEYTAPHYNALDVASPDSSGQSGSANVTTPPITTRGTADLVIGAIHYVQDTGTTSTAGFTPLNNFDDGIAGSGRGATKSGAAPGSYSVTWTLGASHPAGTLTISFTTGGQSGSQVYPLHAPVQARQLPARGGRTASRTGTFTSTMPSSGPPVYPLGHPVQARQFPVRGGSVSSRDGTYAGAGPVVRQLRGPVKAQPAGPSLPGRADSRAGTYAQPGPVVRALALAVTARLRTLPPRGRTASRNGIFAQAGPPLRSADGPVRAQSAAQRGGRTASRTGTFSALAPQAGPPVYPLGHPVQARRLPVRGGSTSSRDGTYAQPGPAVKPLAGPVRAQPGPRRGGSTTSRDGTFTLVILGAGAPIYPLGHPVQARRLPQRGGAATSRDGTFAGSGPPVRPANGPVQARQPLPLHGRATGRAGTFTSTAPPSGPPVYPLSHPVAARRFPPQGGRVIRRAGSYAQAGPPVKPLSGPIGVSRRQPPPPTRGRIASRRGPYAQTGPPVRPLGHALRGQPQKPVLYGRADWRNGTYTFIPPPALFPATVTTKVTDPRDGNTTLTGKTGSTGVTGKTGSAGVADPRDGSTKVTGTSGTGKVS